MLENKLAFWRKQVRSYFGSSLAVYAWDDAMAALEAARQVAAEKRVMKDKLWDHDDRIDELHDASSTLDHLQ